MLTDTLTDDGRKAIIIAHPEHSSGELKIHRKLFKFESGNQALTDRWTLERKNIIPHHFRVTGIKRKVYMYSC